VVSKASLVLGHSHCAKGCTVPLVMGLTQRFRASRGAAGRHSYRLLGRGLRHARPTRDYAVKTIGWWGMTENITHPVIGERLPAPKPKAGRWDDDHTREWE